MGGKEVCALAKCLIVHSAQRNPMLPQASSLTDLEIPERETLLWHAIIAPKGTPADRRVIVERAFRKAAENPRYLEFLRQNGETAPLKSGDELAKLWTAEFLSMGELAKSLGVGKQ